MPDHAHGYADLSDAELLVKVRRGWNCKETPCGTGSTHNNTTQVRDVLRTLICVGGIESIVDAGAGDLHWTRLMNFPDYQGFDLYPRHPDVKKLDITKEVLPKADLILCRHVLNHLSVKMSEDALALFRESGSRYLLMTMCDNQRNYWREYGLIMPEPVATFDDCQHWWLELHDCLPT